jgi:hypothetical protein
MNHPTDDELISAYLDGELSGGELLRAERLLEERPECRQWIDELRAIGGGLRDLPRHTLDEDFAERILRRAEREMLATPPQANGPPAVPPPTIVSPIPAPPATTPTPGGPIPDAPVASAPTQAVPADDEPGTAFQHDLVSWRRWRRPAVWSALATAAALLIMFLGPRSMQVRQADHEIALAPASRATANRERATEAAVRPAGGQNLGERSTDREGQLDRAGGTEHGPYPASIDAAGKPAADKLAKSAAGTDLRALRRMKAASPLERDAGGDTEGSSLNLNHQRDNYQGDNFKPRAESNLGYNYFALEPNGQTSPAQPLTDVLIVQCNVESVDAANRALHDLFAKQQIAWSGAPASGAVGDAAVDGRRGGAQSGRAAGVGGGGMGGGGRAGEQGAAGAAAAGATPGAARAAETEKPGEAKNDGDAPAAEFGFLREVQELGVNRSLDREQLQRGGLGDEPLGRDQFGQPQARKQGEARQRLRRAVLVSGPPEQVDPLIDGMKAQPELFRQVVSNQAPATSDDATAVDKKAGEPTQRGLLPPFEAVGADHESTHEVKLEGVQKVAPADSPAPTPDNNPRLAPLAPALPEAGNRLGAGKPAEAAKESSRAMESADSLRGADRPNEQRRGEAPSESPPAPADAPRPAANQALAEPSAPAPAHSREKAERMFRAPAQATPKPSQPPAVAAEKMPPAQAKPQNPPPRHVARLGQSATEDSTPQAQPTSARSTWFGRAQEVLVPEEALGDQQSPQRSRYDTLDAQPGKGATRGESQRERFGIAPGDRAPGNAAGAPTVEVERTAIAAPAGKAEPAVAGKGQEGARARGAVEGENVDASKAKGDSATGGKGENAGRPGLGAQLRLGKGYGQGGKDQPSAKKQPVEEKFEEKLADQRPRDAAAGEFHDRAPQQVATTGPTQRRVIFVFNVQPSEAAAPATEAVPAARSAPAKPE